jgi:saccharopine dehydrogenase-like NADP-dependent oxidoreductase
MKVAVIGAGAVGARAARQLASSVEVTRVFVTDTDGVKAQTVAASIGAEKAAVASDVADVTVALLALRGDGHAAQAERYLEAGIPVVSVADGVDDVRALLALDALATRHATTLALGAAFAPGLTCVLAAHAASVLDRVDEIHVAKIGTGGPSCATAHHRALAGAALDWRDGEWVTRRAGSGRELCWFPDPIGGADCYRAALADALLLAPAFPEVERITARVAANRRDRVTAHFPMLRPPPPEGGVGAVRVEVRGWRGAARVVQVFGAIDRPALAAGAVAALVTIAAGTRRLRATGAHGVAALVDPLPFLSELAQRGVKAAVFEGANA